MKPVWIAAALATAVACGSSSTTAPTSSTTPPTSTTPAPTGSPWIGEGVRLTNADVGFSGVLADTTTLRLTDGRWRMFLFAGGQYRSAISPDGLSFTMEAGTRLPEGAGHARALRLDDGRVRMYYNWGNNGGGTISSARR